MPELPEVETIRRELAPMMKNAHIVALEQHRPNLRFPFPKQFAKRMIGAHIDRLTRRAKYLVMHLSHGEILIIHLGMTGSLRIMDSKASCPHRQLYHLQGKITAHDHLVFHLNNGKCIVYNDPRRFGFMIMVENHMFNQHPLIAHLGIEPLSEDFSVTKLGEILKNRNRCLKVILTDQRIIAGLGNIYACEILHRANLSPNRKAKTMKDLPSARTKQLWQAIRDILNEALIAGGSTLRDHIRVDGSPGYFQHSFAVYGQTGRPCLTPECHGTITRIVQQGRATFFCPSCQC